MGEISGTVTLTGSPVSGATVYVVDTQTNSVVGTTTTDVNGDYAVSGLPGGVERYHALVEYDDGQKYNAESLPYLDAASTLSPNATEVQFASPTAALADAIPDSGVSRYEFEQDVTDSWGTNDLTDNSSAGYTTDAAVGTYAKQLDSIDDYLAASTAYLDGLSEFSIAGWIYPNTISNGQTISVGLAETDGVSTNERFQTFMRSDGTIDAIIIIGGTSYDFPNDGATLSTGQWQHVVYTYDGSTLERYLDGSPTGSTVSASGSLNAGVAPYLGARHFVDTSGPSESADNFADANLDDIRVYDKGLTDAQVASLESTGSI